MIQKRPATLQQKLKMPEWATTTFFYVPSKIPKAPHKSILYPSENHPNKPKKMLQ